MVHEEADRPIARQDKSRLDHQTEDTGTKKGRARESSADAKKARLTHCTEKATKPLGKT